MLYDYHIHTFRCGHAVGTVEEYVESARKKGLLEMGFSDHLPMYWLPEEMRDPGLAMPWSELEIYIEEVQRAQRDNPDFSIKLGVEADYIPGYEKQLAQIISSLPLDYVLGSVHYLGDWAFDDPATIGNYKDYDITDLYQRYFQAVIQAASSGLFDIISHPDLIKKFGFKPNLPLKDLYGQTASILKQFDLCIDVNAAGWRYPCQELYPAPEFLEVCCAKGVPVTLGSDAHKPEQVSQGLDRAVELLKAIGYREAALFTRRKRTMIKL